MINKDELLFAVDENNQPIEPVLRRVAHQEGVWHRTTDIVVLNSGNEVLCSKRSMLKDTSPGRWDSSFGGHTAPGVDSLQGALEELREESGLEVNETDLKFVGITKHVTEKDQFKNREYRYFYVYHWDGDAKDVKFEEDEISEVKWFPIETLKEELKDRNKWSPAPYWDLLLEYLNP